MQINVVDNRWSDTSRARIKLKPRSKVPIHVENDQNLRSAGKRVRCSLVAGTETWDLNKSCRVLSFFSSDRAPSRGLEATRRLISLRDTKYRNGDVSDRTMCTGCLRPQRLPYCIDTLQPAVCMWIDWNSVALNKHYKSKKILLKLFWFFVYL